MILILFSTLSTERIELYHVGPSASPAKLYVLFQTNFIMNCLKCNFRAEKASQLRIHVIKQHPAKTLSVDIKLISKSELDRHLGSQPVRRKFCCDLCDFTSTKSHKLTAHLESHCNFCESCDFVSVTKKALKTHNKESGINSMDDEYQNN